MKYLEEQPYEECGDCKGVRFDTCKHCSIDKDERFKNRFVTLMTVLTFLTIVITVSVLLIVGWYCYETFMLGLGEFVMTMWHF